MMAGKIKVLNRVTGRLQELDDTPETEHLVASSGGDLSFPSVEQIGQLERNQKYGSTGQQALAAAETVGRTATFGAWDGVGTPEDVAGRSQTLREQSPGTAFAAETAGTVLPALAGGAAAEGLAGLAGAGARAAGAAGVAAEGASGGLASEVEAARAEGRPVNPGLAMLSGIGGEVLGRALPAAIRSGVNRVLPAKSAAAVVSGEAVSDVSRAAGRKAETQLAEDAFHMPPGPERDAALARTSRAQYARADGHMREAAAKATQLLDELGAATKDLEKHVPRTTPGQVRWAADTAAELRAMAETAPEAHRAELLRSAKELVDADDAEGIWRAASAARERLKGIAPEPAAAPAADDLETQLQRSVNQASARKSPVSLEGKTLEDLKALPLDGEAVNGGKSDLQRVADLKADDGFARTGRVNTNDGAKGITIVDDGGELVLRDGRHRLQAARELDRDTVYGQVVDGKSGKVLFEGDIPLKGEATKGIQRGPGGRILEGTVDRNNPPDFSTWDVSDFARGRGGSKAAGKTAGDYSGGARISQYQRSIVDGLKQNAEFASTGRVSGDAGKLGSEPTFVLQPDGTVKLDHGRLRITAARELGRDDVYGRVVRGKGKGAETVYEGTIKVGGRPPAPEPAGAPPAGGALKAADDLLASGQQDPALFGRAAEAAKDLHTSAQRGPLRESSIAGLEDQLAAAQRWRVGSDKARQGLAEAANQMRAAQALRDDTDRAVASVGATKPPRERKGRGLLGELAQEAVEFGIERVAGMGVPGLGFAARKLWGALGDSGQAKVARTVRGMLSPITSSGRVLTAARAGAGMTALQRFAGDAPDARSAYEGRREMLAQVQANPRLASDVVAKSMAGLAEEHPSNFIALSQRMTEAIQYVATNLPPTVAVSLAYPTGVPITDQELRDVADLWNTATEPASALDDIEQLRASPIQMRTLKDVHPDIYNGLRKELFVQAGQDPLSIPSQTKLSMDIMFEADGLGGLFASNEAARYITEARNRSVKKGQRAPLDHQGDEQSQETVEAAGIRAVRTGVTNKGAA